MVGDQYYDNHARRQHPRCPVLERRGGKGTSKVGQVLEDEVRLRLLGRDGTNYERETWSNKSLGTRYFYNGFSYNRIPSLKYFDDTLCDYGNLLNLNKQQSKRMSVQKEKKKRTMIIASLR